MTKMIELVDLRWPCAGVTWWASDYSSDCRTDERANVAHVCPEVVMSRPDSTRRSRDLSFSTISMGE